LVIGSERPERGWGKPGAAGAGQASYQAKDHAKDHAKAHILHTELFAKLKKTYQTIHNAKLKNRAKLLTGTSKNRL
jgi:hypothetical protein